jgi:hypothetical protein
VVGAPSNFTVKHGSISGTVIAKANRVTGGFLQICQADPSNEESWKNAGQFVHCSRIEVKLEEDEKLRGMAEQVMRLLKK